MQLKMTVLTTCAKSYKEGLEYLINKMKITPLLLSRLVKKKPTVKRGEGLQSLNVLNNLGSF